jgi:hypothetical protein
MDIYQLSLIFVPPICAFIGYLGKYAFDKRNKHYEKLNATKLENIEKNIKNFYFPIYNNLTRENIIWNKIITYFRSNNDENNELIKQFYQELDKEILKIHLENQQIIKERSVDVCVDEIANLSELLMQYDEHVTIYQIIRKLKSDNEDINKMIWPGKLGSNYPEKIMHEIENKLNELKNERLKLLHYIV